MSSITNNGTPDNIFSERPDGIFYLRLQLCPRLVNDKEVRIDSISVNSVRKRNVELVHYGQFL